MRAGLIFIVIMSGCATTFERVQAVATLAEARVALQGDTPTMINQHPPNAEAWYFGWQHCVLFIDGQKRHTRTVWQEGVPLAERATVDCSLDNFNAEQLAPTFLGELNGAETLDEARAHGRKPTEIQRPLKDVERWYYGTHRCALFVGGKLTQIRVVTEGQRATCAVE